MFIPFASGSVNTMRVLMLVLLALSSATAASSPSSYTRVDPSPNKFISKIFAGGQTWNIQVLAPKVENAQVQLLIST
ncbi:hypothetical protein K7W42_22425 [Deinococcus sp. HMF7604]|uniref:hypothetical protein n=1 Tax=Deinococcus betulae TaxID=2873312 RepID=UPI001CCC03B4|nr:hypothetical protein [Deinococcus betulae]MBZ9753588.1 hypothetical protein [Deinococcus betulae]